MTGTSVGGSAATLVSSFPGLRGGSGELTPAGCPLPPQPQEFKLTVWKRETPEKAIRAEVSQGRLFKREREEDWLVNGEGCFRPFSEFWDKISLCCSPGYPKTCCVDERALYLSQSFCFCLPSADVTDLCHHALDEQSFNHSFFWGLKYVNIWPLFTF